MSDLTTMLQGDCLDVLPTLDAGSVQSVCTSPPYWSLRDYNVPPTLWPTIAYRPMPGLPEMTIRGCAPKCAHVWAHPAPVSVGRNDGGRDIGGRGGNYQGDGPHKTTVSSDYCQRCGGWRGCLGLEPAPEMYTAHMVHIFRLIWRVLREDGTCWLNLGDSFFAHNGTRGNKTEAPDNKWPGAFTYSHHSRTDIGLKPKDLMMVPARVALALQADGWYLRMDCIWAKSNAMPESVTDRPSKAHEYVFLLAKQENYYYDQDAIREPHARLWDATNGGNLSDVGHKKNGKIETRQTHPKGYPLPHPAGRNARSVWNISTSPYAEAHFAVMPEQLAERCILASTSAHGACAECGATWERIMKREGYDKEGWGAATKDHTGPLQGAQSMIRNGNGRAGSVMATTVGWQPTCSCFGTHRVYRTLHKRKGLWQQAREHRYEPRIPLDDHPVTPSVVLDPFGGSGTTATAANRHGRRAILIDLNSDYLELQKKRTNGVQLSMESLL